MKTFIKIILLIFVILVAAVFVAPFIFEGKIVEKVKTTLNENVNAKVDFRTVSLNMFNNFPDFSLTVGDLSIVGIDDFAGDTLTFIPSFSLVLDLRSVFAGEQYEVKKVFIDNPKINLLSLADGSANWDIVKKEANNSTNEVENFENNKTDNDKPFSLFLKKFEIANADISYVDVASSKVLGFSGVNMIISGRMSGENSSINTKMYVASFDYIEDGVSYISNLPLSGNVNIDTDIENQIFTFRKNEFSISDLRFGFDGTVALDEDDINLDLTLHADKAEMKSLLSLIPANYSHELQGVEASGDVDLEGFVNGVYNKKTFPSFMLRLNVKDGSIQYPALPEAIQKIEISMTVEGKDVPDNTEIEITRFSFALGDNPVSMQLHLKTPVSDPYISGEISAKMNLDEINKYYPLNKETNLSGKIEANANLNGFLSSIEKEEYDNFQATGTVLVNNLFYNSPDLPDEISINRAQLNFAPEYLDLVALKMAVGENDISAKGKLSNYLAWAIKDDTLVGSLDFQSKMIDLNSLLKKENAEKKVASSNQSSSQQTVKKEPIAPTIPGNLDLELTTKIDKLISEKKIYKNLNGILTVNNGVLDMKNVSVDYLGGHFSGNALYNNPKNQNPNAAVKMSVDRFEFDKTTVLFPSIKESLPIVEKIDGDYSLEFKSGMKLNNKLDPIVNTIDADGIFKTSKLILKGVTELDKIADEIKLEQLKNIELDPIDVTFFVDDGTIFIKPFNFKSGNITGTASGSTTFEKEIDYLIHLNVPRKEFGSDVNGGIEILFDELDKNGVKVKLPEVLSFDILVKGTVDNPEVSADFSKANNSSNEETFENLKKELEEKVQAEIKRLSEKNAKELEEEAKKLLESWL